MQVLGIMRQNQYNGIKILNNYYAIILLLSYGESFICWAVKNFAALHYTA